MHVDAHGWYGLIPCIRVYRRSIRFLAAFCAVVAWSTANAQGFPTQPLRIVVPFPPGGGADSLARIIQPYLAKTFAQAVIIESRPGAAGRIGADVVANAAPDGYTILMSSTASLTAQNVAKFAPVTLVSASPYVIAVNPKVPAKDVRELIEYGRRNPGKLTFGSSGTGSASHLSGELFKSMAKVEMLHVPYKGTGQAVTDLLAGTLDVMFAPAQTVMPQVQGGKLRALAVTSARRASTLPQLPTAAESGLPGYEAVGWFGLLAPVATPPEVVARIAAVANDALADRDIRKQMLDLGAEPWPRHAPSDFARFIRDDMAKWAKLMAERGIQPE